MNSKDNFLRDQHGLIPPYGGDLKNLQISEQTEKQELIKLASHEHKCTERNACDIELLMVGAFSPLEGFMNEKDYNSVIRNHRDTKGFLFGLPIVLDSDNSEIEIGDKILLTFKNQNLAVIIVETKWEPDKKSEAEFCYGTNSLDHPAVKMIFHERGRFYIGGKIYGFELPKREFPCDTPSHV